MIPIIFAAVGGVLWFVVADVLFDHLIPALREEREEARKRRPGKRRKVGGLPIPRSVEHAMIGAAVAFCGGIVLTLLLGM